MAWVIEPGDLDDPAVIALLQGHLEQLRSISPPESAHVLDLEALRAPAMDFWVATDREDETAVLGCVALKRLSSDHAELKSMRTAPGHTGRGIGAALLVHALTQARAGGVRRVSLETGAQEFFAPAHRLYLRHGFTDCEPFADYRPDPLSRFLTLTW